MEWIKKNKILVGLIAVLIMGGLAALVVVNYNYMIRNQGEVLEQRVTQLHGQSRTSLSACIDKGNVAAQVTQQEFEELKEILIGVASARYQDGGSAEEVLGGGSMFSAIVENYPTIDQRSWQNLQVIVVGCRDAFQGAQNQLLNEARIYNEWRVNDDVLSAPIKSTFPSDELKVETADGQLTGQAAYDYITRVISVEAANTAFESGELEEQDLFGDEE